MRLIILLCIMLFPIAWCMEVLIFSDAQTHSIFILWVDVMTFAPMSKALGGPRKPDRKGLMPTKRGLIVFEAFQFTWRTVFIRFTLLNVELQVNGSHSTVYLSPYTLSGAIIGKPFAIISTRTSVFLYVFKI